MALDIQGRELHLLLKGNHSHKYPVGHKSHSLRTVTGVSMVNIITGKKSPVLKFYY